jgi:hypothetical protein
MSHHSYTVSRALAAEDYPFSALIMAAMRKADSDNTVLLNAAFPEIAAELKYRYWSGGGLLPGEDGYDASLDDNLPHTKEA